MEKALFLYSSSEGQTLKILRYIENELFGRYECEFRDLRDFPKVNLKDYDKVLIGASIRYGRFNKTLYKFIEQNLFELKLSKSAFFCVNLTARKKGKDTPEGSVYMKKFQNQSQWKPQLLGVFAGALYYPRYCFYDRIMIQLIMKITGGETDRTKEVEYTNWESVRVFSDRFSCI